MGLPIFPLGAAVGVRNGCNYGFKAMVMQFGHPLVSGTAPPGYGEVCFLVFAVR